MGGKDKTGNEIFEGPLDVKTHTGSRLFIIMKRNSYNELLCVLPLGYNSSSTKSNFFLVKAEFKFLHERKKAESFLSLFCSLFSK